MLDGRTPFGKGCHSPEELTPHRLIITIATHDASLLPEMVSTMADYATCDAMGKTGLITTMRPS